MKRNNIIELITEGISPTVYHQTDDSKALSILQSGKFDLSYSGGANKFNHDKKESYYLSTSRTMNNGYSRDVSFELDGKKLMNNYKGQAIDYWGDRKKSAPDKTRNKSNETEDRIFTNKASIPIKPYVKAVHYYTPNMVENGVNVRKVKSAAERAGIKLHIYTDKQAYKNRNTAKARKSSGHLNEIFGQIVKFYSGTKMDSSDFYNMSSRVNDGMITNHADSTLADAVRADGTRNDATKFVALMKKHGYTDANKFIKEKVIADVRKKQTDDWENRDKPKTKDKPKIDEKKIKKLMAKRDESKAKKEKGKERKINSNPESKAIKFLEDNGYDKKGRVKGAIKQLGLKKTYSLINDSKTISTREVQIINKLKAFMEK